MERLEKKPDSTARKAVLQEEIQTVNAEQDSDLLKVAESLLAKLNDYPSGHSIISQTVTGDRNIFSGTGNVTIKNDD